jgi:hypothetical protein
MNENEKYCSCNLVRPAIAMDVPEMTHVYYHASIVEQRRTATALERIAQALEEQASR